jgi:hypothetical protein
MLLWAVRGVRDELSSAGTLFSLQRPRPPQAQGDYSYRDYRDPDIHIRTCGFSAVATVSSLRKNVVDLVMFHLFRLFTFILFWLFGGGHGVVRGWTC